MKILVTGGRGLVGSAVVQAFVRRGIHVLNPSKDNVNLLNEKSVRDYIQREQPKLLIHSAWVTTHGKFWMAPENENWLKASLFLAREFYENGGEKFVGLGTCAEYAWEDSTICQENVTPLKPATLYGQKKLQFGQELLKLSGKLNRKALWGRVFFPYGPGEKPTRVIPTMINALIHKVPTKFSSGHQMRDFMFTRDLADLIVELALSRIEGVYNLSSGEANSLRGIGKILCEISKAPYELLQFSEEPLNEPQLLLGSTEKRDHDFPWKPTHGLAQGLEKTFIWWLNQENKK